VRLYRNIGVQFLRQSGWLVFDGTFSTNRLYRAIFFQEITYILHRWSNQHSNPVHSTVQASTVTIQLQRRTLRYSVHSSCDIFLISRNQNSHFAARFQNVSLPQCNLKSVNTNTRMTLRAHAFARAADVSELLLTYMLSVALPPANCYPDIMQS